MSTNNGRFSAHIRLNYIFPAVDILDQEAAERQLAKTENLLNRTTNKLANTAGEEKRAWFQTPKQRVDEKQRLAISEEAMNNGKPAQQKGQKRKGGKDGGPNAKKRVEKTPEEQAEERVQRELLKVAQVQAKFSKAKNRVNKLRAVDDESERPRRGGAPAGGPGKKAGKKDRVVRSNFEKDLTDVTQKGAQKFRYQATKAKNDFARNKAKGRPTGGGGAKGTTPGRAGAGGSKTKTSSVKLTNKAGMNKFNKGKNFGAPKQRKGK